MVGVIYGYKWSLTIYQILAKGINRPDEIVRNTYGLRTKVLNQCLRKNMKFGIFQRISFNEVPPRVEYEVTEFGRKFMRILDEIEQPKDEIEQVESN